MSETSDNVGGAQSASSQVPAQVTQSEKSGGDDAERTLWEGSYSGRAMYGVWMIVIPITMLVVGCTIWGYMSFEFLQQQSYFVWLGLTLVLVLVWGIPLCKLAYKRLSLTYKLTTQRLVHTDGFFLRKTDQIELIDIEDVNFVQNLFERMIGVGRVKVESSDVSHPVLIMEGIADVAKISDQIDRQRREERQNKTHHVRGS